MIQLPGAYSFAYSGMRLTHTRAERSSISTENINNGADGSAVEQPSAPKRMRLGGDVADLAESPR